MARLNAGAARVLTEAGDAVAGEVLEAWLAVPLQPAEPRIEARAALLGGRASDLSL